MNGMNLYKVKVETYYFGIKNYTLLVLAHNMKEARELVHKYPSYHYDEEAEIKDIVQVNIGHEPQVIG